jgi:hypothetical protein
MTTQVQTRPRTGPRTAKAPEAAAGRPERPQALSVALRQDDDQLHDREPEGARLARTAWDEAFATFKTADEAYDAAHLDYDSNQDHSWIDERMIRPNLVHSMGVRWFRPSDVDEDPTLTPEQKAELRPIAEAFEKVSNERRDGCDGDLLNDAIEIAFAVREEAREGLMECAPVDLPVRCSKALFARARSTITSWASTISAMSLSHARAT